VAPISICDDDDNAASYRVDKDGSFQHEELTITKEGVRKGSKKELSLKITYDEIKIYEKLGSGSSGVVHRARYKDQDIAVKIISIFEREKRHQILREIRSISRPISPFVASFIGAFFKDGSIFIALEYLNAGSMEDILKVTLFPVPAIRVVSRQLMMGLNALHGLKQLHRDIKPSNICLTMKGEAKLCDFGISREMTETLGIAKTFVGTFTYMSPERIEGNEYQLNSDVWSLGLTLLQGALGKYPYRVSEVYLELMQQVVHNPSPTFPEGERDQTGSQEMKELRNEFRSFIAECLQKDPKKRKTTKVLLEHKFINVSEEKAAADQKQFVKWLDKVFKKKMSKKKHSGEEKNSPAKK